MKALRLNSSVFLRAVVVHAFKQERETVPEFPAVILETDHLVGINQPGDLEKIF